MKRTALLLAAALAAFSATGADVDVTKVRVKEVPEKRVFAAKKEIKMADVGEFAMQTLPELAKKATELKLGQRGPIMLCYHGFTGDYEKPFTIEADYPVWRDDDDYVGDFAFRTAPKFKCASVIYQGAPDGIGAAWQKLVSEAEAAGYKMTGESRELFLSWEAPDSANNITELQLGIE